MNCIKNSKWILLVPIFLSYLQPLTAQDNLLQQEVSIVFKGLTLKESLEKLETTTGITTAYNDKELKNKKITISFDKELLSEVLDALLKNENLSYKLIGRYNH